MATTSRCIQHIYYDRGKAERLLAVAPIDPDLPAVPSVANLRPVTRIMSRGVSCGRPELEARAVADLMTRNRIGCLPIVNDLGGPIGMITKHDLVEQLLGSQRPTDEPVPRTARELMMPLALTLGEHATIAHAAAMMAIEDIHHIVIVDEAGVLIGVVSSIDVVRWLAANDGFTAAGR